MYYAYDGDIAGDVLAAGKSITAGTKQIFDGKTYRYEHIGEIYASNTPNTPVIKSFYYEESFKQ